MENLRAAAQAVVDSLDAPDSAVERLRLARHVAALRAALAAPDKTLVAALREARLEERDDSASRVRRMVSDLDIADLKAWRADMDRIRLPSGFVLAKFREG